MYTESSGVTLIHTGDLHLGFSYSGMGEKAEERQRDNLETFLYITSLCQSRNIDILLIAGDLFDMPNPSRTLLERVRKAFADIGNTLVIISPGNHDYYEIEGIYDEIEAWSDNVYIFHGEMDCFEFNIRDNKVRIYGAAFTERYQREPLMRQRRITRDMVIPIGVFHGDLGSRGAASDYNRITSAQIEENQFSYTALGHLHSTEGISYAGQVPYAYCGSPEGHGFDETGVKGIYIGRITHEECELGFLRTCRRQYIVERICIEQYESMKQLSRYLLNSFKDKYGEEYKEHLYQIRLYGENRQELDFNRMGFYLTSLYYVEIVNETTCEYRDNREFMYKEPMKKRENYKQWDYTSGNISLAERYTERLQRLIDMEKMKKDCDERKVERYKRALQLGQETIRRHSG